jgi:hypothetical protein
MVDVLVAVQVFKQDDKDRNRSARKEESVTSHQYRIMSRGMMIHDSSIVSRGRGIL